MLSAASATTSHSCGAEASSQRLRNVRMDAQNFYEAPRRFSWKEATASTSFQSIGQTMGWIHLNFSSTLTAARSFRGPLSDSVVRMRPSMWSCRHSRALAPGNVA